MIVPPHDIPVGKKLMVENAGRSLQRLGKTASKTTSSGTRKIFPVEPERSERAPASICVAI